MKKKKIKKLKYSNIVLTILITLLIILLITTGVMVAKVIKETLGTTTLNGVKVLDTMDKYEYSLTENHTDYFKSLYYELKDLLEKEKIVEEEYAILVTKLFIADFYDLNSKLNKTDVGGVQFVYHNYRESFQKYASDSTGIYYYLENNIYGDRKQKLPVVKKVEVTSVEKTHFAYDNIKDDEAYKVHLTISYKENIGYQSEIEVILIHNKEKLEVVEIK